MVAASTPSEVAVQKFSSDELASIQSMEDALALLRSAGVAIAEAADTLGDGFAIVEDKNSLVNVPFLVIQRTEHLGDFGPYSILRCISADGNKFVLVDGSTGIHGQFAELASRGVEAGIMCRRGLTRSDYKYTDDKGEERPATTYYVNTAA